MLLRLQQLHSSSNQLCIAIRVIFSYNILASNYIRLQYFGFTFSHLTNSQLQIHIITIFRLQITSGFNISATFIQQSTLYCYKGYFQLQYIGFKLHPTTIFWLHIQPPHQLSTTSTHYNNILVSNYIQYQYIGFNISATFIQQSTLH